MSRNSWFALGIAVAIVALVVVFAWPPADPFAGARTVALRESADASPSAVDPSAELRVVLNDRDLIIVGDERLADVVVSVTDAQLDLGNAQLVVSGQGLSGRATATCRIVNAKTGRVYIMDLILTLKDGKITADLVGRRFWELWKARPSF